MKTRLCLWSILLLGPPKDHDRACEVANPLSPTMMEKELCLDGQAPFFVGFEMGVKIKVTVRFEYNVLSQIINTNIRCT
jgi:hypothetical protein